MQHSSNQSSPEVAAEAPLGLILLFSGDDRLFQSLLILLGFVLVVRSSNWPRAAPDAGRWPHNSGRFRPLTDSLSLSRGPICDCLYEPVADSTGRRRCDYGWFTQHLDCRPSFFHPSAEMTDGAITRGCVIMALQPLFIVADYHYAVIYMPDFLPLDLKSKADTSPKTGCGIYSRLFWGELWKWRTDVCSR